MTRRHQPQATILPARPSHWERALAALVLIGTAVIPLVISWRGENHFRVPKQLALIAMAIVCTAVLAAGLLLRRLRWPDALRLPLALAAAGLGWALVSTVASTNRALSLEALLWGAAVTALFLVMAFALRGVSPTQFAIALFLPGVVNATLLLLQAFELWNPWTFTPGMPPRLMRNALLGNPNDVGAYLACVTLFAVAGLVTTRRWPYAGVAILTAAAIVATETLTAIAALTAALIAMLVVSRPRLGVAAAVIVPPLLLSALLLYGPTQARLRSVERSIRAGAWGEVMSARLPAFLAAWEMFRDRPLVGVGPGTFKRNYMEYFAILEKRHPHALIDVPSGGTIFAQTHSDHLQLLAETGLPGYLVVIGGILAIALRGSRRRRGMARLLGVPAATLLLVLMVAGFPLQLAAPVWTCMAIGAASLAWRDADAA